MVARIESFAAVSNGHRDGTWCRGKALVAHADAAVELGLLSVAGRYAGRRRGVSAVVTARVTRFATFIARTDWPQRSALDCLFFGSGDVGRLR